MVAATALLRGHLNYYLPLVARLRFFFPSLFLPFRTPSFQFLFSFIHFPRAGSNTTNKMPKSYLLSPDSNTPPDDPAIIAFFVLMILGGNVLIPLMVLASFVQGNKYCRSPIFMNFCAGWIAYSIGFLLS